MRLWGVAMVRNEADIIEAFVRHNLSILDGLVVVDHGSADATPRILAALCAERLPLVVLASETVGYLQAEIVTSAVREAFARLRADAVFPLDADEFLRVRVPAELVAALAALPPGHFGRIAWPTFVPPLDGEVRGSRPSITPWLPIVSVAIGSRAKWLVRTTLPCTRCASGSFASQRRVARSSARMSSGAPSSGGT